MCVETILNFKFVIIVVKIVGNVYFNCGIRNRTDSSKFKLKATTSIYFVSFVETFWKVENVVNILLRGILFLKAGYQILPAVLPF